MSKSDSAFGEDGSTCPECGDKGIWYDGVWFMCNSSINENCSYVDEIGMAHWSEARGPVAQTAEAMDSKPIK